MVVIIGNNFNKHISSILSFISHVCL